MITQQSTPPHTMRCTACGATWNPPDARGKTHPTDSSLDREARKHFQTCPKPPSAGGAEPAQE